MPAATGVSPMRGRRTLVVAGDGPSALGREAAELGAAFGWPVVAPHRYGMCMLTAPCGLHTQLSSGSGFFVSLFVRFT